MALESHWFNDYETLISLETVNTAPSMILIISSLVHFLSLKLDLPEVNLFPIEPAGIPNTSPNNGAAIEIGRVPTKLTDEP